MPRLEGSRYESYKNAGRKEIPIAEEKKTLVLKMINDGYKRNAIIKLLSLTYHQIKKIENSKN